MVIEEHQSKLGNIIAKAWADPMFKERLVDEPKTVLAEEGIETPDDMSIKVVENTANKLFLTLPINPIQNIIAAEDIVNIGSFSSPGICCLPPRQTLGGPSTWR